MSRQALEALIGRAMLDEAFRVDLFAAPEAAWAEYDLTDAERAALKLLDAETLDACAILLGGALQQSRHGWPLASSGREGGDIGFGSGQGEQEEHNG